MKTAMQDLIDDLKKLKRDSKENDSTGTFEIGLNFAIARAERRLEKEKEHIVNAFEIGYKSCDMDEAFEINRKLASGEQYFNKTYKEYGLDNESREILNKL